MEFIMIVIMVLFNLLLMIATGLVGLLLVRGIYAIYDYFKKDFGETILKEMIKELKLMSPEDYISLVEKQEVREISSVKNRIKAEFPGAEISIEKLEGEYFFTIENDNEKLHKYINKIEWDLLYRGLTNIYFCFEEK